MEKYKNSGGDSSIRFYEIEEDRITVQFKDGSVYLYTNDSTGIKDIEKMKAFAISGQGLNSFISTTVRKRYASKLR